jgi:hypothetical protein
MPDGSGDDLLRMTDNGRGKWMVYVRAEGRAGAGAAGVAELLAVADLGGDLIEVRHVAGRVTVQVLARGANELAAYESVIRKVRAALDKTWSVVPARLLTAPSLASARATGPVPRIGVR